jgi:hypothetical protein
LKHTPPTRSLGTLLGDDDALKPLLNQARRISALQSVYLDALARLLDEDLPLRDALARNSRAAAVTGSTLIIGTSSPAAATRLKSLAPALLKQIQIKEQEVTEILVEMQPGWAEAADTGTRSVKAREPMPGGMLDALAARLNDSPLKDAVERIRKRRDRQSTGRKSR